MRVILRQPKTGLYLQSSGQWFSERVTAMEFESVVIAYWWALERSLRAEVWLASEHSGKDSACMRVQPLVKRPIIDCRHEDWTKALHSFLYNDIEVDLTNFNFRKHGVSCELIAQAFTLEFSLSRHPQAREAHFRKKAQCLGNPPRL